MPNTYGCNFIFYGDDSREALENRIIAALEAEDLDFDPTTVNVELVNKEETEPVFACNPDESAGLREEQS